MLSDLPGSFGIVTSAVFPLLVCFRMDWDRGFNFPPCFVVIIYQPVPVVFLRRIVDLSLSA